jgi:uncharacterized protein (PEP-CTERM system associated)
MIAEKYQPRAGADRLRGIASGRLHQFGFSRLRVTGVAVALGLLRAADAAAFPLIDPTNQDQVPQGTELAAPDAQDLQHQLQIVNGLAAPPGGGWTFVPRIDVQELLTDNVEQQHSARQADLVSYFAPGFSLVGDLPRLQMSLSYAPTLSIYARTGSLDSLSNQLNGQATLTLVPDLAYVDVRALSGVHNLYGGLGGIGTIGAPAGAGATAQTAIPTLAGNTQGLNKNNEVETTSFSISPYLLHNFGDWGTGKIGYSLGVTRSDTPSGFASVPLPTGGTNGQTLLSNEEIAHFATGDILEFLKNTFDLDMLQGQTTVDTAGTTVGGGIPAPFSTSTSSRIIATDTVSYALTHSLVVFVSGGHEDITYSNQTISSATATVGANGAVLPTYTYRSVPGTSIHDLTWSFGGTWTPRPDSSLTVSYGHNDGFDSFSVNGRYQATARTLLTASYGSTLGTQLEYLQNQLNLAATNGTGGLVNGQTGGTLFGPTNALAVQDGLFRTDSLTVGSSTTLDRDIISFNLLLTKQTNSQATSTTGTSKSFSAAWLHQMRPDMTVSGTISLAIQDQMVGAFSGVSPGYSTSVVAGLAWQYQLSDTLSASVRYSFLEQQSPTAVYSFFQNMLILGISKTF